MRAPEGLCKAPTRLMQVLLLLSVGNPSFDARPLKILNALSTSRIRSTAFEKKIQIRRILNNKNLINYFLN
jgi:hypothetical protein